MKFFLYLFFPLSIFCDNYLDRYPSTNLKSQKNNEIGSLADDYEIKNFKIIKTGAEGLPINLMAYHYSLYKGYVDNLNKLKRDIQLVDKDSITYGALIRRLGWEYNGVKWHEYYFDNMVKDGSSIEKTQIAKALITQFGTIDNFKNLFKSTGLIRGIGWVVLYFDPQTQQFMIDFVNEHAGGVLTTLNPLLVMDVWEHAYLPYVMLSKEAYIEAFIKAIDWEVVDQRYVKGS